MSTSVDPIRHILAHTGPLEPVPTSAAPVIDAVDGIRAVLFDVYGTLVISGCGDIGLTRSQSGEPPRGDGKDDPVRSALAGAGIPTSGLPPDFDGRAALLSTIERHHAERRAEGVVYPEVDILAVWRDLLAAHRLEADDERIRHAALAYELAVNPVWPMPGMAQLIDRLAGTGLVLGIVSNAQFYTPLMLQAFLGRTLDEAGFDPRCCAWSYRLLEGKPSTRVYREALAALQRHHGIEPAQTLYIGNDKRNDIWPAQATGCKTALFAGDARSLRLREDDPEAGAATPDRIVTELHQVGDALLAPAAGNSADRRAH
ncbi:MAG: HAD family hydrolase [Thiohalocapsa sp.]|nr:HAD family hydrolase [Thiohalocapsa sp.]MCF7991343.1 HAD family hydrolase [Thiohalocapsa sp.]